MVNITLKKGQGQQPFILEMKGHALYGKPGQDVLCSALSILMHTAAKTVEELEKAGDLLEEPTLTLSPGQGYITFLPKPPVAGKALTQMETLAMGLELLGKYYPNYVTYKEMP